MGSEDEKKSRTVADWPKTLATVVGVSIAFIVLMRVTGTGGTVSSAAASVGTGGGGGSSLRSSNMFTGSSLGPRIVDKKHKTKTIWYYALETCHKCKRADVISYKCKDTFGDMVTRFTAASGGTMLQNSDEWNFMWMCQPFFWDRDTAFSRRVGLEQGRFHNEKLLKGQKVNYVPGARTEVYPKSTFCKHVKGFWGVDTMDEFFPACFVFPGDEDEFLDYQERHYQQQDRKPTWVFKKSKSSLGRDVTIKQESLTREDLRDAEYIQRIVHPPFLAKKRKFDVRLYAAVPSFDPFRIYVYSRGYVRRTYVDYDPDFNNLMAHITNTFFQVGWAHKNNASDAIIEKMMSPRGTEEESTEYTKWSMRGLIRYASQELGIPQAEIWRDMRTAIAKTMASVAKPLSCRPNIGRRPYPCKSAFQMFGVDILMNADGHSWVIEANTQPGFTNRGTMMWQLHTEMIGDLMTLTGVMPNLDNHIDVEELRAFLVERGFGAAASMHAVDLEVVATMVKEYAFRGNFDLAFPDPRWGWEGVAEKLIETDKPLYEAFLTVIRNRDFTSLLTEWRPPYAEPIN